MAQRAAAGARAVLGLGVRAAQPAEVKHQAAKEFFKEVCRCLPWVLKNYRLEELTTVYELRRNVASLFKKYASVESPEAIDLLVYKGREELEMILMQHKQRHHIITQYVHNPAADRVVKPSTLSPFLEQFYKAN
ncbi:NADH dehydrogenase [ubiquinone] 1 alpha subcomplex subunit 6 [Micractinium conductrix]|uniref:NADH dehydrogenase [ubiquinone] 1 alpha subcomplex subunit 6 n=1 Tax=Micractinium conductrix TaxID=554055 RepID=A0A2P6UZK4_9CHLO|nr:NADH dehydrogenase [ubiquinone] 1 alpha subcomplex subunit 6 [Micractinium conductrix]|eukprot:PSC67263.1 NADH dehydrogenase [ubiquinone] 1 alpha subcomplex subunit 6 [Micractinium conductrix]